MIVYSDTTQRTYETEEAIFYRNLIQSAWLLSKPDTTLLDIFCDSNGKMVLVFPKEIHKKYICEWAERSHNNKDNNE